MSRSAGHGPDFELLWSLKLVFNLFRLLLVFHKERWKNRASHLVCPALQLWETEKVHTSSAICLKRDSDVLFNDEEIIVSAADNCNRLQVSCEENQFAECTVKLNRSTILSACFILCVSVTGTGWQNRIGTIPVRGVAV